MYGTRDYRLVGPVGNKLRKEVTMRERVPIDEIPKSEKLRSYLADARDVTGHKMEVEKIPDSESQGPPFSGRLENNTFVIDVHVRVFLPLEDFFEQGIAHEATHDRLAAEGYQRADFLRIPSKVEVQRVNWLFAMIEDIPVYQLLNEAGFPVCDLPALAGIENLSEALQLCDPSSSFIPESPSLPPGDRAQTMARVTKFVLGSEMVQYPHCPTAERDFITAYLSLHEKKIPDDAEWAKSIIEIIHSHGVDTPERFQTTVNLVSRKWELDDLIQY